MNGARGAELHGLRVAAAGQGGPPIVLLPGGLGRIETLEPALDFLARRRRTLALGWRSGLVEPERLADAILDRVAALVRAQVRQLGAGGQDVAFRIALKDGKVSMTVKAVANDDEE